MMLNNIKLPFVWDFAIGERVLETVFGFLSLVLDFFEGELQKKDVTLLIKKVK